MFEETPPIMGPYWFGNQFAGNLGLQVPEEVPLTVNPEGQPTETGAKTKRQVIFNPAALDANINTAFNGLASGIIDSNGATPTTALRRLSAKINSTYQNYRRMRADGIVAIGREVADGLVCTNQWSYEPEETEEGEDDPDFSSDEIKQMVRDVKRMWEGRGSSGKIHEGYTLREFFLSESCRGKDNGNHTLEVAWDIDDDGPTVGELLPLLAEHTRPLVYAGTRTFAGVRNWGMQGMPVDLEPQYCVRFIYDAEGGDMGGRSRFENCKDWIQLKWELREKMRTDMNITIGNTPIVRFPTVKNNPTETAKNQSIAGAINIALRQGMGVTVPGLDLNDMLTVIRNTPGVDPSKIEPWGIRNLETQPNSFAGFKVFLDAVDEQILFGLLVLPRTVREADHGSKADAEQHTDTQIAIDWRWLTYVAGLACNITDSMLIQRYGPKAKGKVQVKAVPIADEAKAILRQVYTVLLSDADLAMKILNIRQDLAKLQIKPKPDFDQDEMIADREAEKTVPVDADGLGGGKGFTRAMDDEEFPHKYSSTQIQLDENAADCIRIFGASIPEEELAEDGREKDIHATVKYGLHSNDPAPVRTKLKEWSGPITYSVGVASLFPATADAPYDVLKLDVNSDDLHSVHQKLSCLPNADTRPAYQPHVTIAYLKPGMGAKYVGQKIISDEKRSASTVVFSGRDGIRTPIPI